MTRITRMCGIHMFSRCDLNSTAAEKDHESPSESVARTKKRLESAWPEAPGGPDGLLGSVWGSGVRMSAAPSAGRVWSPDCMLTMDEGGTAYLLGASGSQLGGGRSLGLSPPGPPTQDAIRSKWCKDKGAAGFCRGDGSCSPVATVARRDSGLSGWMGGEMCPGAAERHLSVLRLASWLIPPHPRHVLFYRTGL